MTTATKPRSQSSELAALQELERLWDKATQDAKRLGTEHNEKVNTYRSLSDERRRLLHRDPGLADHLGQPTHADNDVGQIDKAIADLGDIDELGAKVAHARRLAEKAKQDAMAHIQANFSEIVEQFRPQAEAAVEGVRARADELAQAIETYLNAFRRSVGLTEPIQGLDGRHVPGVDHAAAIQRTVADLDLPVPVPGEGRLV